MNNKISELLNLNGRTALVTGGATGIGASIAKTLAAAGACVVVADINLEGANLVASEINGHAIETDVTDPASAESAVTFANTIGKGISILVNNAGSYHHAGSILDQSHESWTTAMSINLESMFCCSKPAAQIMTSKGLGGTIVNIASVDGILPCLGTGYDTAKAGVIHFTRTLALDLAPHQIRVNAVSPGNIPVPTLKKMHSGEIDHFWPEDSSETGLMGPMMKIRSDNIPLGRKGDTEEIANAVLFLSSNASSYITGQNLVVDGGWTLI
jgi:NAD(P)-dependent dehydrogenase (short-subunit alcohol dehydrogenase family)